MARKPRMYFDGALYHIVSRGNHKQTAFLDNQDKEQFLKRLHNYSTKYRAKVLAYTVMDNHFHILIKVADVTISKVMQLILQTYTVYFNKKYDTCGHVFSQRFKSFLVDKDQYLLTLIKYIHYNCVKAKISDLNYIFSSHKEYISGESEMCDIDEALNLLHHNKQKAINRYIKLMKFDDKDIDINAVNNSFEIQNYDVDINEHFYIKKFLKDIKIEFQEKHNISCEQLKGRRKRGRVKELRDLFIKEVIENKAMKQVELSKYLGISANLVSRIVNDNV